MMYNQDLYNLVINNDVILQILHNKLHCFYFIAQDHSEYICFDFNIKKRYKNTILH